MSNLFRYFEALFAALTTYVAAAVNVLASNTWLMVGSLFLLLTVGKSVNVGKAFSYKSK